MPTPTVTGGYPRASATAGTWRSCPWLGGHRGTEDKHLSALITAVDQVEKGTTACYDLFFEFPAPSVDGMEAVASAYSTVGIRAVIAPMVSDLTFYQSLPGFIDVLTPAALTLRHAPIADCARYDNLRRAI